MQDGSGTVESNRDGATETMHRWLVRWWDPQNGENGERNWSPTARSNREETATEAVGFCISPRGEVKSGTKKGIELI